MVWPFVDPADEPLIGLARQRGYAIVSAGATARLRIWWSSFDEYVARVRMQSEGRQDVHGSDVRRALSPLVLLLYWMWRVRLKQNLRGLLTTKVMEPPRAA